MTNWDRLEQLLAHNQFEIINYDQMKNKKSPVECRAIYLMNDSAESFLVFKNIRFTGNYLEDYEGDIQYRLDKEEKMLRINQGESVFVLFFDSLELECNLYNYGSLGHFWVKGYENLRNIEYQIAVIYDKYFYLGKDVCNPLEIRLAGLKEFPPLNYVSYPSSSLQYVVLMDNPWKVSKEAIDFMKEIARKFNCKKMVSVLEQYRTNPSKKMARRIARMLAQNKYSSISDYLYLLINEAAKDYPQRKFDKEAENELELLMDKAKQAAQKWHKKGMDCRIYIEEPFVFPCDETTMKVYVMTFEKGIRKRKVKVYRI